MKFNRPRRSSWRYLRRKLMEPGDRHGAGLLNLEGFLALVVVLLLMELMDLLNLQEH